MYKAPIDIVAHTNNFLDDSIYKAIVEVGVNVDKEELVKALQYDRQQYDEGYKDGVREFAERLRKTMTATSKTTSGYCKYIVTDDEIDNLLEEMECD